MRLSPITVLALTFTLAAPAFAGDDSAKKPNEWRVVCANNTKDGSRMVQGTDLVIEAGEKVKDAVAVEGNVIIRKGAVVEDAVAIRGRVIVEAGAQVKGDAVSLGGEVRVHSGARVDGNAVALGGRLTVDKDDAVAGDKVSLSFEIGGKDVVRSLIEGALDKELRCHIIDDADKDV
jgi:NDP-sugar pyrophosphorylase family protein